MYTLGILYSIVTCLYVCYTQTFIYKYFGHCLQHRLTAPVCIVCVLSSGMIPPTPCCPFLCLTPLVTLRLLLVRLSSLITLLAVILIQIQCTQPVPEQKGTECSVDFTLSGIFNSSEIRGGSACPVVSICHVLAFNCKE